MHVSRPMAEGNEWPILLFNDLNSLHARTNTYRLDRIYDRVHIPHCNRNLIRIPSTCSSDGRISLDSRSLWGGWDSPLYAVRLHS